MDVKEKAKICAIKAFEGKVRKAEPEKESVLHSIDVAKKLEKYGFDDNVVAAGYLHDIIEDTNYKEQDIYNQFGSDILSLVKGATEEDRTLSWEERKLGTIKRVKNLDIRHKAIITCDKISNSEDLLILFGKTGREDYDAFRRGKDKKKWYWEEVYKSLIHNQDKKLEMFQEFNNNINNIFYNNIINNNEENILKYKELELIKLINLIQVDNDYLLETFTNNKIDDKELNNIIKKYLPNLKIEYLSQKNNNDSFLLDTNIIVDILKIIDQYHNNLIGSDLYICLLDKYINILKNNINSILYLNNGQNNNNVKKLLTILKDNNILYEERNISRDIDICNTVIDKYRDIYLNNINKKLKKIRKENTIHKH